jgi:hypothetical protein
MRGVPQFGDVKLTKKEASSAARHPGQADGRSVTTRTSRVRAPFAAVTDTTAETGWQVHKLDVKQAPPAHVCELALTLREGHERREQPRTPSR